MKIGSDERQANAEKAVWLPMGNANDLVLCDTGCACVGGGGICIFGLANHSSKKI